MAEKDRNQETTRETPERRHSRGRRKTDTEEAIERRRSHTSEKVKEALVLRPEVVNDDDFRSFKQQVKEKKGTLEDIRSFCEETYPGGIQSREFTPLTDPDENGLFLAIDQRGKFDTFDINKKGTESLKDIDYTRWLCEASFENPLVPGWEGLPKKQQNELETSSKNFAEYLANESSAPENPKERNEWINANTDTMTGLYNRSILEIGKQMYLEGKRISVVSFDGDNFGALNKLKGLDYGDWLIRIMGAEFQKSVRNLRNKGFDVYAGRMGGEEFVILGECSPEELHDEMAALKDNIAREIQKTMNGKDKKYFQDYLLATKQFPHDVTKDQIGTATIAISEIDYNEANPGLAPEVAIIRTLTNADHHVERMKKGEEGKNGSIGAGRNVVVLDDRDEKDNAGRINHPPTNELSQLQNTNAERTAAEILRRKEDIKLDALPKCKKLYQKLEERILSGGFSQPDLYAVKIYVASPLKNEALKTEILNKNNQITWLPETLTDARKEYQEYASRHEPALGTLNKIAYEEERKNAPFEGGPEIEIDIYQFKCLNEILGHTNADRILDMNVQCLYQIADKKGVSIRVMKDLTKLRVALPANLRGDVLEEFKAAIKENFAAYFQSFIAKIDEGIENEENRDEKKTEATDQKLEKWLRKNQTAKKIINEPRGNIDVK